jgi:hypothetical protein
MLISLPSDYKGSQEWTHLICGFQRGLANLWAIAVTVFLKMDWQKAQFKQILIHVQFKQILIHVTYSFHFLRCSSLFTHQNAV